MKRKLRICFTGGGTGGHIYPALTIYQILKEAGLVEECLYLGNQDKAEGVIIPKTEIPLLHISSAPFAGVSHSRRLLFFYVLIKGVFKAIYHLFRFRPHVIVATGGYVSAPVVFAAFFLKPLLKIRIVIQEQNVVPGIFNKFASLFADLVLVSFRESAYYLWSTRCVYSGYPLRPAYCESWDENELRQKLQIPPKKLVILSYGGSMGARSINRLIPLIVKFLAKRDDIYLVHITGMSKDNYKAFEQTMMELRSQIPDYIDTHCNQFVKPDSGQVWGQVFEYRHDLIQYQQLADIILTRAGAGAVAELAALKKAAILIPKWGLPGDHQELNAFTLAARHACRVVFEKRNENGEIEISWNDIAQDLIELITEKNQRQILQANMEHFFFSGYRSRIAESIANLFGNVQNIEFIDQVILPELTSHLLQFDQLVIYLAKLNQEFGSHHYLVKYYNNRLHEFQRSTRWEDINKAIKLAGALGNESAIIDFFKNFATYNGFQRRNLISAASRLSTAHPIIEKLILAGLADSYFEVRTESIKLMRRHLEKFRDHPAMSELIKKIAKSCRQPFETQKEALLILPWLCQNEQEFFSIAQRFQTHKNIHLRQSLIQSIFQASQLGRLKNTENLRNFVKRILIISPTFSPQFHIRSHYGELIHLLEEDPHG